MKVAKTARPGVDGYDITLDVGDVKLSTGEVETAYKNYVSVKDGQEMPRAWQMQDGLGDLKKYEANAMISEILDCFKEEVDRKDLVRAAGGYVGGGV